jgi:hypothetical protein
LSSTRDTCLLFDTPQLVRHLEDLYRRMMKDFRQGLLPSPDLSHMDIYYDVGLELNLEGMEAVPDDVYRSRYEEKLAISRQAFPAMSESRFPKPMNSALANAG